MAYLLTEGDHRVYYEDQGTGQTVVALIHGWGMSGRVWDGIALPLLDDGYRVIVMDHRGCGRSDHDFPDMGIDAIASDLVTLLKARDVSRVVLNGWSLGGSVATRAAAELGPACAGLVLTAAASPIYTQKPELPLGGTAEDVAATVAAMRADRVGFLSDLAKGVCAKPVRPEITEWMARCFIDSSARASETIAELAQLDQRELLLGLDIPILSFVCGQDAILAPAIPQWVADNHPRARAVSLPESGHAPFLEERDAYLAALRDFLSSL